MDDHLALRISLDGHATGRTPALTAVEAGWSSLVISPPHDAGRVDPEDQRSLRALTGRGVRLVWDGRGTGPWVDAGRARIQALERAREQVRGAAGIGAGVVVLGCGSAASTQPPEARWDQMAAGLAELSYEAEREGVQLALEAQVADLDIIDNLVSGAGLPAGVRVGLDHTGADAITPVPEAWWSAVAWIRLGTTDLGAWAEDGPSRTVDALAAAATFPGAAVEVTVWSQTGQAVPVAHHAHERVPTA